MIGFSPEAVQKRLDQVISRIECKPYRIQHIAVPILGKVAIFAWIDGDPYSHASPAELDSLATDAIVAAVCKALQNSAMRRVAAAFHYRGRRLFSPRHMLPSHGEMIRLIEQFDREALSSAPRTFAVSSRGVATIL